ncbi:hypothetical protein IW140_005586 [Coemansia sp. RSA 1813]|nr:hypothetical protein LPJ74_005436 [Coemansia sp. RSA 1843]KAJ2211816.1 hypothetical protein EV179_005187 [Coemansia sp. RSA 487]KAJ2564865.1 hypothetical protein IW140_005586 [Coemansia sp. RSA 1813]
MPFSSSAPELRLELNDDSPENTEGSFTELKGRLLVHVHKPVSVQGVFVEFVGEESVSLRAWVPLSSNTVSREVLRQRVSVHERGELKEGVHEFAFSISVPPWVPSSLERDMCRIRYLIRAAAPLTTPFGIVSSAPMGSSGWVWAAEREVSCRRIRVSRRLARRKRIDQSVGCPDGSCHVRFYGSISRDVVKPGAQIKLDVSACTSDARYGLRVLVANFAECVMCHVQVKGEERLVNKITNLATCRLDTSITTMGPKAAAMLASGPSLPALRGGGSGRNSGSGYESNNSTFNHQAIYVNGGGGSSCNGGNALAGAGKGATMARHIRASHVIQVPHSLSQFSSDYVSREYRLMLVAEVCLLEDAAEMSGGADSSAPMSPSPTASTVSLGSSVVSLPSSVSSASRAVNRRLKRQQHQSQHQQHQQHQQQHQSKLSISDQSSAIAAWPIEIVDRFDVCFDDLVSPRHKAPAAQQPGSTMARTISATDPEVRLGEYRFTPPPHEDSSGGGSPGATASSSHSHHRRTSSGLVGYLIRRGLRSVTPSSLSPKEQQHNLDTVATAPPEVAHPVDRLVIDTTRASSSSMSSSSPRRLHRKARSNSAPFRSKER